MHYIIKITALFISIPIYSASAQSESGHLKENYKCNFAKTHNIKPGAFLDVRSGAGENYPKTDQLNDGTIVYTCDEQGEWIKIFYSDVGGPCSVESPGGLDVHQTAKCKSGWVKQDWIDVLSG